MRALIGVAVLALPGCVTRLGGSVPQDRVIARQRAEIASLREEVLIKQRRIAELEALLIASSRPGAVGGNSTPGAPSLEHTMPAVTGDALAFLPAVTSIELDRFSGVDRTGTTVIFYVKLLDARSMFTQGVGTLLVEVFAGEVEPASVTAPVASRTLSPAEFRGALHSGFAGTFYKVVLPLSPGDGPITLRATFTDALSGLTHTATRVKPARGSHSVAKRAPKSGE